ncbi:MAG TPA: DUF3224 domain-containing protein [Steroidobacteraceae bacterium]|nr:DUF3224 domain-containing protein [Steroidobacteraceae bacterium]
MSQRAAGAFDVKVVPQKPDTQIARAANLGRLTIDKRFHGDLEGISKGEMLATQTEMPGSAGYVALERVTGKLNGRTGSFVLQHSATMARGKPTSSISVVPDSGTGELQGLTGKMTITVETDGGHSYEFDYKLEE